MKTILAFLTFTQLTYSAVVVNSNVGLESGSFADPYEYALTIEQYPPPGASATSIFFDTSGEELIFRTMNLDGGSFWYFTMLNDVFSSTSIAQGSHTLFNQPDQAFTVPYGNFYFGVRTGSDFGEGIEGYGWALLNHSESGLTLLGSAITYDMPGIIIGTTTTIPEIQVGPLMIAGLMVLTFSKRRRDRFA